MATETLEDIIIAMSRHTLDNPTHGYNCACKDRWLRAARSRLTGPQIEELAYLARVLRTTC